MISLTVLAAVANASQSAAVNGREALKTAVDDGDLEAQREADYYLEYLVAKGMVTPK